MRALRYLVWLLLRGILSLRYRIRVTGMDSIKDLGPGKRVLVLPNHPGYSDPAIILSLLGGRLDPRPLVFEGTFNNPFMWPVMKIINALKVPDMQSSSAQAREQAQAAVQAVIDGLKKGDNHILWPSGRLQRRGYEVIGGAESLTQILTALSDSECEIVLTRMRGLWGSMYGYAYTGDAPNLSMRLLGGLGTLLSNFLFFTPRRDIHIHIERLDRSKLPELERSRVNAFFEAWYNAEGPEQPTFVPYHFLFGPRTHVYPPFVGFGDVDVSRVKEEIKTAVLAMLSEKVKRPLKEAERRPDATLDEMGLSSIDRMEFALQLEDRFGFTSEQSPLTVGHCWALAAGQIEKGPPRPAPRDWSLAPGDTNPPEVLGETIPEAFVERALRNRRDIAIADDLSGCLNYERMLIGAVLMSKRLGTVATTNVGLMLPASVAGDIAFLALHLAGKVPVLLNWTTGQKNLDHAATTMGLTHVVTSKRFIDRTNTKIEGVQWLFVENLREDISRLEMLRTLLVVRRLPGLIRSRVPKIDPDQPAAVLFTSGSEKAPKAVPLTHRNILTNIRAAMSSLGLTRRDAMLGFLPAFHSFGLTVTSLGPILCGFKLVRHPDPTDASSLARKTASYGVTVLAGTPTFFSYILDRVKEDELKTLRLVFVGAEKCPETVFRRAREAAPNAQILEGYGITECSPIVAVNVPTAARPGSVGKPLPCVETRVVRMDADGKPTDDPVMPGEQGMLLVSGPTIFPGYLAYDGDSPFREIDGRRWYVTGDLVEMDPDGFIHFRGRLKRFIKVAGEMVSLTALEEPFQSAYPTRSAEEGPRVAVEGIELEDGRGKIVLFTTEDIELRDANARLAEAGFRGVMRLDEVRKIEKIPQLGSGKPDNKVLRAMITG